ncbi:hypothetical protein M153_22000011159 [Pseudoloma neurophilia]|uniref:Uncharacterized protein n=1 Tax=Pseudoloma neurophilia TaxID=146866 RepID=A0A0R0M635_9MICR|nr:hypothetical protein M153_22000011159 [Pseudoloma neurophilia]
MKYQNSSNQLQRHHNLLTFQLCFRYSDQTCCLSSNIKSLTIGKHFR